jgi:hypothetical protein
MEEESKKIPKVDQTDEQVIALEKWERSKALAAARQRRKRARDAALKVSSRFPYVFFVLALF